MPKKKIQQKKLNVRDTKKMDPRVEAYIDMFPYLTQEQISQILHKHPSSQDNGMDDEAITEMERINNQYVMDMKNSQKDIKPPPEQPLVSQPPLVPQPSQPVTILHYEPNTPKIQPQLTASNLAQSSLSLSLFHKLHETYDKQFIMLESQLNECDNQVKVLKNQLDEKKLRTSELENKLKKIELELQDKSLYGTNDHLSSNNTTKTDSSLYNIAKEKGVTPTVLVTRLKRDLAKAFLNDYLQSSPKGENTSIDSLFKSTIPIPEVKNNSNAHQPEPQPVNPSYNNINPAYTYYNQPNVFGNHPYY